MDERNPHTRSKRTHVLRAADVMPPFDKSIEPMDAGRTGRPEVVTVEPADERRDAAAGSVATAASARPATDGAVPSGKAVEIPSYDLAANILADQRRIASRRRRGPGRVEDQPTDSLHASRARTATSEPLSQDLLELQRIVAEIVARDIERLRRRPNRQPVAHR